MAPKLMKITMRVTGSRLFFVLNLSRVIFRPKSSKVSVQKNVLCPFHCKSRPSAVSLESPGLEYIPEVAGNRTEVGENHDARKTVSATL